MKTILVPIDSNKEGDLVAEKAIEIAKAFESKVHLVHVTSLSKDIVVTEPGVEYISPVNLTEYEKEMDTLNSFKAKFLDAGLLTEVHLLQGFADKQILKLAEQLHADLIVLGYIKHSALYKAFVGSVSEGVIKGSKASVLLIPANHNG